jgi:predicted enzyme related to lactoylglutathione lyase
MTAMNDDSTPPAARAGGRRSTRAISGAPAWVSLTSHDLAVTQKFYTAVLGWEWRTVKLGDLFRVAEVDGVPVAGVAAVAGQWQMAVSWTTYFAVENADKTASRVRERGGTLAVGPLALPLGRTALLADRDGASFGIWQGELSGSWEAWRKAAPVLVRLHTRDAFDSAIFYGEVLEWASGRPGGCEVRYDGEEVIVVSGGEEVARIESGALGAAPDPSIRPHWQVHFAVEDVLCCVRAAEANGGTVLRSTDREAVLRDPEGALFTVYHRPTGPLGGRVA